MGTIDPRAEALRRAPLFADLAEDQLLAVAAESGERDFAAGDHLIRAGDTAARAMWVIIDGSVEVRAGDTVLATLGAGDTVGEMALLGDPDTPRSADVVATAPVRTVQIARWDLATLLAGDSDLALALMASLAARIRRADELLGGG